MDDWFPVAESMPIAVRAALEGITDENDLTDEQRQWWELTPIGHSASVVHPSGHWFNFVKLDPNEVCGTIPKASGNAKMCYWDKPCGLSIAGYKRIGSFPGGYQMSGVYGNDKERIGNSVPPLFMRSIARNVKSMLQTGQPIRQSSKLSKVDDYPAFLEACWQEHLAPRAADAPTVVSTFAGAGGSSLGYSMAGFRELLAVEWDDNAVATFKLNFPDVPVYHGDIAKLSAEDVLQRTGLQPGQLDVFDGSPPCQGFSTAGKRDFYDDRNQLFREYVRLLRGLQPKVLIMENVSGMVKGKMKLVFADILRELKASGYRVSARLLNAMYFNVPQSRERMIFVGVREDLGVEPSHPAAQSVPIVVSSALINCPPGEIRKLSPSMQDAAQIMVAGNYSGNNAERAFVKARGKTSGAINTKLLSWNRTSCTLPKSVIAETGIIHPNRERYLTIDEAKRIGSFADPFIFEGEYKEAWSRIGNSVPPLMMRSVAKHIRAEILARIEATNAP